VRKFAEDLDRRLAEERAAVEPDRGEDAEIERLLREAGLERYLEKHQRECREGVLLEVLRVALANVVSPPPRSSALLEAEIVGLAIGFPGLGGMGAVAKRHGIGTAAVSRRAKAIQERFGLPPSIYMKSDAASENYRKSNRRKRK